MNNFSTNRCMNINFKSKYFFGKVCDEIIRYTNLFNENRFGHLNVSKILEQLITHLFTVQRRSFAASDKRIVRQM